LTIALSAYPGLQRDDRTSKVWKPNAASFETYPELPIPFAIDTKMDRPTGDSRLNLWAIMLKISAMQPAMAMSSIIKRLSRSWTSGPSAYFASIAARP